VQSLAGGVPVLVPPIHELAVSATTVLQHFDGVLLPGGGDVDPRCYGQEPTEESLYGIVAANDELDMAVASAALELDLPMLALCRGCRCSTSCWVARWCKTSATTSTGCASTP
jgi:putative glutamine amidotransferase